MAVDYKALGKKKKNAREINDLTQEQLSEIVDLSVSHISHMETGRTKASLEAIVAVANALNTTVDSLLHDSVKVSYSTFDKDFKDLLDGHTVREKQIVYDMSRQLLKNMK